jgi:tRNA 2-thiouridine synthesizing protein A
MAETTVLNCVGMKCPRPIIEIAKAARRLPPGGALQIEADDLAFESDLRAWCETTGAQLKSLQRQGDRCLALVQLPG